MSAPLAYWLGRAVRNPELTATSAGMDSFFFRGYSARNQRGANSDGFYRYCQAARFTASSLENIDTAMEELFVKSHGQILQDVMCCLLMQQKLNGYFVEVGVGDGTQFSNTLMLERDYGWAGILAEPARMFHAAISRSRSATLSPKAVSDRSGETLVFEEDPEFGELSGLSGQRVARGEQKVSRYNVTTIKLDDLLDENKAPDVIDYVSIDTEGSELGVLAGLTLSKRKINFVTIEHNQDRTREAAYDAYFGALKYRKISADLTGFDAWYVHPEIEKLRF
jgi:FkbM family methyltransferase